MLRELRFVFRTLVSRPAFALVALATLAIGIGANTAVFSLLDALYFRPLPVAHLDELAAITSTSPNTVYGLTSYQESEEIAASVSAFEDVTVEGRRGVVHHQDGEARMLLISYVTADYFETLGVTMHRGGGFTVGETTPEVIVNHHFWRNQLGGREEAIGSAIQLNDTLFTVMGVTPPDFEGMRRNVRTDVWVRTSQAHFVDEGKRGEVANRFNRWFDVYGRLAPGAGVELAQAQLNALSRRWENDDPKQYHNSGLRVESLAEAHRRAAASGALFLGLVGMVLLIACANVANLTLARCEVRRRELAIRAAIGASRGRLIRHTITETTVLSVAGGLLGLLCALWLMQLFPAFLPPGADHFIQDVRMDERALFYTALITLAAAMFVGVVPALRGAKADLVTGLKAGGSSPRRAERRLPLRDGLVVAQIAVCVVVLAGAGLLVQTLLHAINVNPGFDAHKQIATFYMVPHLQGYSTERTYRFFEECRRRLMGLPQVQGVSYAHRIPTQGSESGWASKFTIPGKEPPPGEEFHRIKFGMVGPDYFEVIGSRILRGRGIDERDMPDSLPVAVVTETMARTMWPGEDPIGKRIVMHYSGSVEREIVGVATDLKIASLYEAAQMYVYVPISQCQLGFAVLLVEVDGDPEQVMASVKSEIASVDPAIPVLGTNTLANHMRMVLYSERSGAWIGLSLSALALVLGAVGLYGVVSLVTGRRTREFGLRMALGAERRDVLGLVLSSGFRLGVGGVAVGLGASLVASRYLASQLHGVDAFDPVVLGTVTAVLLAVTAAASLAPAWRATRVDPVVALRYE